MSLTQRESLCVFSLSRFLFIVDSSSRRGTITQERKRQLPAHLDLPILIPRNNLAKQHKVYHPHHSCHLRLLLPRRFLLSLVPLGQWEQSRVLISLVLDGALVSWVGFAACLFRTWTVTTRGAVAMALSSGTTPRCNTTHTGCYSFLAIYQLCIC
jgi:hypothetical protein